MDGAIDFRQSTGSTPSVGNWEIASIDSESERENDRNQRHKENGKPQVKTVDKEINSKRKMYRKRPNKKRKKLSNRLISMFQSENANPPGGKVTPTNYDEAMTTNSRQGFVTENHGDNIQMKTIKESGHSDEEGQNAATENSSTRYSNPSFIPNYMEEDQRRKTVKRAYDSNIYSVNSAGNPVPITIESEIEEEEEESSNTTNQQKQLTSNEKDIFSGSAFAYYKKSCCCKPPVFDKGGKVYSLWTKTYQPDSFGMSIWLLIITLGVLFNAWSIPLRSTFYTEIQQSWQDVWFACDALFDFLFVLDIFIIFRTSYVKSGVYVADIKDLNRYHRRRWSLILDIFAILPTDLLFLNSINPYFRLNRLLKFHRAFRFYRIVETGSIAPNVWRLLNLVHMFVLIIHYNACFYYGLSENHGYGDTLTSWMFPNPKLFPDFTELYRRYTHSFYWSAARLSVIGGHALPTTDWQYVFSLYLQLLGVAMAVTIIGFITAIFIGKTSPRMEFERTIDTTRQYMNHRKLPKDLQRKVIGFYQYCWNNQQFASLEENSLLAYLPGSIREEMEIHANFEALKQVSEFSMCEPNIIRQLVMKLHRRMYLPGQFVYRTGDVSDEMYIVGEGVLQVIREGHPSIYTICEGEVFGDDNVLGPHQFIRRVSDVVSYGYSELYVLTYKDIQNTLSKYPKSLHNLRHRKRFGMFRQNNTTKAFGGKYFNLSTANTSGGNDSAMKSLSNIHYRLFKGDSSRNSNAHSSGYASNHANSDQYSGRNNTSPTGSEIGEMIERRPSFASNNAVKLETMEKLNVVYEESLRNMRTSIEEIWASEISSLRQRLEDTETERDLKSKEISNLRRIATQNPKEKEHDASTNRRDQEIVTAAEKFNNNDVIPSKLPSENISKERRNRVSTFKPGRTILNADKTKVIKTVQQETGLDMFGSINSIMEDEI